HAVTRTCCGTLLPLVQWHRRSSSAGAVAAGRRHRQVNDDGAKKRSLKAASCLIDGEAVACGDDGLPVLEKLRSRRADAHVFLSAFDLLEVDGRDLRREPIERRKVLLIRLLAKASVGLQVNDHIVEPGDVAFRYACQPRVEAARLAICLRQLAALGE